MSKIAAKAEREIERAALKFGCSEEGITWMKNTLDPFPDIRRDLVGYPDTVKTPSVVQYYREQLDVSRPGGGVWDAIIYHPGYEQRFNLIPASLENNNIITIPIASPTPECGLVEVRANSTGMPMTPNTLVRSLNPKVSLELPHRIVALGIEIYNTTPDLYKGGSIVTYRQPAILSEDVKTIAKADFTKQSSVKTTLYSSTPVDVASALLLDGSLEWGAEEGSYCVGVLSEPINELKSNLERNQMLVKDSYSGVYWTNGLVEDTHGSSPATNVRKSGFDHFGSYLTNLNENSTLSVVIHYIIERFPNLGDTDLITMAHPSLPYDPRALEMYTKLASKLPTGTMVKNNDLGSFLSTIGTFAKEVIPTIASSVGTGLSAYYNSKAPTVATKVVNALDKIDPLNGILPGASSQHLVDRLIKENQRLNRLAVREQTQINNLKNINSIKDKELKEKDMMRQKQEQNRNNNNNQYSSGTFRNNTFISSRGNKKQQNINNRASQYPYR